MDLSTIPGAGANLLSTLMAELGTGAQILKSFRSAHALSSWLGLCPATRISGGKLLNKSQNAQNLAADGVAVPLAINNAGAVTGATQVGESEAITPFLYRDATGMEDIPTPFGRGHTINDNFVVTGDGGFVWYANEMRLDYIFNDQPLGFIRPNDINEMNQITGFRPRQLGRPGWAS